MIEKFPQSEAPAVPQSEVPTPAAPAPEDGQWGMITPEMKAEMDQTLQQASGLSPEDYAAQVERQKQNVQNLNVSTERSGPAPESAAPQVEATVGEPVVPEQEAIPAQEMQHKVEHGDQENGADGNNEQPHEEQHDGRVQDPEFAHEMANEEAPLQEMLSRLKNNRNVPESIRKQSMEDLTKEIKELERSMERQREVQDKIVGDKAKEAVVKIQKFAAEHPEDATPDFDELLQGDDWEDAWDEIDDVSVMFRDYHGNGGMEGAQPLDSQEFGKAGKHLGEVVKSLVGAKSTASVKFNSNFGSGSDASFMELYETEFGTLVVQDTIHTRHDNGATERSNLGISLTKMSPDQVVKLYERSNLDEGEHFNLSRS